MRSDSRSPIADHSSRAFHGPWVGEPYSRMESGESEAHVVVRNCGDLVSQNFVMLSLYVKINMLVIING